MSAMSRSSRPPSLSPSESISAIRLSRASERTAISSAIQPPNDDPPAPRQAVEKRLVLRDIVAAMQEQQRRPVAGDQRLDRDPAQIDVLHGNPALSLRAQRRNLVPHALTNRDCFVAALLAM